jgi:ABC-2 type transport system permease protein
MDRRTYFRGNIYALLQKGGGIMNLYLRELRKNRRGLVIWTIILSAVIVLVMSVYPSISAESKSFEEMYKTMPEAWLKAFNLDTLNMANLFEYYSMEGYLFITLFGSIYSIILS